MIEAPQDYKQAGLFMAISGGMQIMVGLVTALTGLMFCVSTYGMCCFCPFLGVIPIVLGAVELNVGLAMQGGRYVPSAKQTNLAGLVVAVVMLSALNVVLEALAMSYLNKPEVQAYLEQNALTPT